MDVGRARARHRPGAGDPRRGAGALRGRPVADARRGSRGWMRPAGRGRASTPRTGGSTSPGCWPWRRITTRSTSRDCGWAWRADRPGPVARVGRVGCHAAAQVRPAARPGLRAPGRPARRVASAHGSAAGVGTPWRQRAGSPARSASAARPVGQRASSRPSARPSQHRRSAARPVPRVGVVRQATTSPPDPPARHRTAVSWSHRQHRRHRPPDVGCETTKARVGAAKSARPAMSWRQGPRHRSAAATARGASSIRRVSTPSTRTQAMADPGHAMPGRRRAATASRVSAG